MGTRNSLKITSVIQIAFCIYYLISFLFVLIGTTLGPITLANIALFAFYLFTAYSIMHVPVCFLINLLCFLQERKNPEARKTIGKKWIWIFVWPVITTAFWILAASPFVRVPIGG